MCLVLQGQLETLENWKGWNLLIHPTKFESYREKDSVAEEL
jgi:hypothetical protein